MDYEVCIKQKECLYSARKVETGQISILAECADAETAEYLSSLLREKGLDTFVVGSKDHIELQSKYTLSRDSIVKFLKNNKGN